MQKNIKNTKSTILSQLLLNIIIPVALALIALAVLNYTHTRNLLRDSYSEKNYVISDEIKHLAQFQDLALNQLDEILNEKLKQYSQLLVDKYFADTKDIKNADLYQIRQELGMNPTMEDIYIINRNGIVINTTYKKDLNLNFFNFGEEHKNYLLNIMDGDKFVSEGFAIEDATKRLRKYTYQPTNDKNYIIEIGIYSEKADEITDRIKKRLINISGKHTRIKSVNVFIGPDNPFSLNTEVTLTEKQKAILMDIFKTKEDRTVLDDENGEQLHYEYTYMERENTVLYKSSVIQIISNRSYENLYLRSELFKVILLFGVAIVILILLVLRNTKAITSPIEKLVESIDNISHGNLNQRAEVLGSTEIRKLAMHFNQMLKKIEARANENQQQKEEIRVQAEQMAIINKELEKLSIVASKTDNGVSIYNKTGNLEWINSGFERIYGFSYSEIVYNIGTHIKDFNENPDIELLVNICLKTKQSINFETLTATRNGSRIWVQTTLTPILDDSNNVQKFVAIDSNITSLKRVEEKLRQKNKDITDSINYAKRIQEAILPDLEDIKQIFPDSFVFFKPKSIVSGDFYWFKKQINKVLFAAVDCTGHGIPGALIGMLGMAYLNEIIGKDVIRNQGDFKLKANQILNYLRQYVIYAFHKNMGTRSLYQTKDGMDIALCVFDTETYKLSFAGAYNPLYIIRNNEIIEVRADKMPIGLSMKDKGNFQEQEIQLEPDDLLYLFSDGYSDQFGGERGKKFLAKNFKKLLLDICEKSMPEQIRILENTFNRWKGDRDQVDDILIMGIKIPKHKVSNNNALVEETSESDIVVVENI